MAGTYSQAYVPTTGDTITVARWNSAWNDHYNGNDFAGLGDYSASNAEMRTTTDPYPSASESLPTAGTGELERLRYLLGQLGGRVNQSGYWYQDPLIAQTCFGRLTLTSGTAVTTSDVTAATTIYFTPYKGSTIALYDGTSWVLYTLSEISIAVPATTNTMYDLWVYDNSGTLTLEALAWTNDTTRATALALQNGVYCKTGALTRRYVGSFRTTGSSGQTEDSLAKRYLWNYYNRVVRPMRVIEGTDTWTYSTASYRQANANTANQLDFVQGVAEDLVEATVFALCQNNTTTSRDVRTGIGLDSTTTSSAQFMSRISVIDTIIAHVPSVYSAVPTAGRHYLVWLEFGQGNDTQTWFGDNSVATVQTGIYGKLFG